MKFILFLTVLLLIIFITTGSTGLPSAERKKQDPDIAKKAEEKITSTHNKTCLHF